MRRQLTLCGAVLALVVTLPAEARAQDRPQTREGFFISFGLGGGSFGCGDCNERETGPAGYLKLGGTLGPSLLLGAESGAWTKEEGGVRLTHANLSAVVQYYPSVDSGFFLKGGLGFSRLEVSASEGSFAFSASDEGLGLTAGLGYDVRLGSNFSLSPYGSFAWGDFDGGSANHIQLGLGFTWH